MLQMCQTRPFPKAAAFDLCYNVSVFDFDPLNPKPIYQGFFRHKNIHTCSINFRNINKICTLTSRVYLLPEMLKKIKILALRPGEWGQMPIWSPTRAPHLLQSVQGVVQLPPPL